VDSGTALGTFRNQSIIPYDYDIDLNIWSNQSQSMRLIPWSDYDLRMYEGLGGFKIKTGVFSDQRVDIMLCDIMEDKVHFAPSYPIINDVPTFQMSKIYPRFSVSIDETFPLKRYILNNITVWGAKNMTHYLTTEYGPNFRTPIRHPYTDKLRKRFREEQTFSFFIPFLTLVEKIFTFETLHKMQIYLGISD
jgi:hypothetical protein